MALGARPQVQLLLQSACTSMCRHIYNWNIVDCDVKQPIHHSLSPQRILHLSFMSFFCPPVYIPTPELYIYVSKKFCTTRTIFFVFKTCRICNFAGCEEKCMKQYRYLEWICRNKYRNFLNWLDDYFGNVQNLYFPKISQKCLKNSLY